jgi:hypothetical protein
MAEEKPDTDKDEIGAEALDDVAGGAIDSYLKLDGVTPETGGGVTDKFLKIDPAG